MQNRILFIIEHGAACNPLKYKYKHSLKYK